ncbi:MAG: terminase family protein [Acidaminococcaceae bacterium]|nr:terminase family protein [Acidaminococcaceae bacterium]
MKVIIPYTPRPIWKNAIHPALDKKDRAVLIMHRRFGKTVGSVNQMIKKAVLNPLRAPQYAYIAPFRNQAKRIAWEYLKYYTNVIPGIKRNEADLFVELPSRFKSSPGARIYIIGADKPDALRGMYLDGVILDEYAQIKPSLYGEIITPALADRKGFCWFIGTPKGQNHFYDLYLQALKDERYFTCLYRADETKVFTPEKLEEMKRDMTDIEYRQEMLCDFTASASNIVMTIDLVTEAAQRQLTERDVYGMPVVFGLDVARFGDDDSVLTIRQGLFTRPQLRWHGLDTMELAARMAAKMMEFHPALVIIDGGAMGPGVIDRLRQLGWQNVVEVNFGQAAMDPQRYANARAEMYFLAKKHLEAGGCIPDDSDLKTELTVTEYSFTAAGKIQLQPKAKIKELTGRSPDGADSFCLTFAVPVDAATLYEQQQREIENQEYDPYGDL